MTGRPRSTQFGFPVTGGGPFQVSAAGAPGKGIATAKVDGGYLVLGMTNGEQINAGQVTQSTAPPRALMRFRAALAARDLAPCDILVIGDSISEGYGATQKNRRWTQRLQDSLRRFYGITGGEGYIEGSWLQQSFGSGGWTYGGNIGADATFGFGQRSVVLKSPDGYLTRSVTGTSISIAYTKNSSFGSFSLFVDGSTTAALTVNTGTGATTTTDDGGRATYTFPSAGTHTVSLKWSAGGNVYLNGIFVYNGDENSGIRVTNSAKSFSKTSDWSTTQNSNQYVMTSNIKALAPDLVVIGLGGNDRTNNVDPTQYRANLADLIAQIKNNLDPDPSILLLGEYVEGTGTNDWSKYEDQMAALATNDPNNITFMKLTERVPNAAATPDYGFTYSDGVHPSDIGHAMIADAVLGYVLPR